MEILFGILITCIFVYLIYEKYQNDRCVKSFTHIIHVNGTRGKTTLSRMIYEGLSNSGYKTFVKTTGTRATYIDVSGNENIIVRRGLANIKEQLKYIRLAKKQGAEILIIECMAINEELQYASQHKIVKGDITIITNSRVDHYEIGRTKEETSITLSKFIGVNGDFFTCEDNEIFRETCKKNNTNFHCIESKKWQLENINLATSVIKHITKMDEDEIIENISSYRADYGTKNLYKLNNGSAFLNLFSTNDTESTFKIVKEYKEKNKVYIYNNRRDRGDRLLQFSNVIKYPTCVIGESVNLAKRIFRKKNIQIIEKLDLDNPDDNILYIGIGNIKGDGMDLINVLEARNE